MNEAELKAQRDAARIVRIVNPFDFDYTHAWGGIPYTLPVGKPLLFPFPLGDHLATHLARQALIRKAPLRDEAEVDGKGKDRPLWSDESINELKAKIMTEEYTEEIAPVVSETEIMRRKIEELNKAFSDLRAEIGDKQEDDMTPKELQVAIESQEDVVTDPETPETPQDPPSDPNATEGEDSITFMDKKDVVDELNKRGIKFDARKGKAELEKLLV